MKGVCTPCLRGAHQLCTTPACKCAASHGRNEQNTSTERRPVRERTSDEPLLERAYASLSYLRKFTQPAIWNEELVSLYLDIEAALNAPRTGTVRRPKDAA